MRLRHYLDRGLSYLEVKRTYASGGTRKWRRPRIPDPKEASTLTLDRSNPPARDRGGSGAKGGGVGIATSSSKIYFPPKS